MSHRIAMTKRCLGLIVVFALLSGCASDALYRPQFNSCVVGPQQGCEPHAIQRHHPDSEAEFLLGFVEIDDQGQLRDRAQLQSLLDELYTLASQESLLINVFVHGWHHNAAPEDSNVRNFEHSLAQLSELESQLAVAQGQAPRRVVGIYVGWRGESITTPVLNQLTFWERKNTAQEVGQLGMAELLLRLEEISNVKNTQVPPIKSRLVVVGHSFGGLAVYSATAQILADRFVDSRAGKAFVDTAKGFGDLVVLLNPAFEALRYAPLYDLAQARCSYFPEQRPRLVILTSESDYATKLAFPVGRVFSTFFENHNTIRRADCQRPLVYREGAADRHAVGHFEPLLTHELRPASRRRAADYSEVESVWRNQQEGGVQPYGATELVHLGRTAPRNPYLNVRVDGGLIEDHNDIFREEIAEFLRMLIVLSARE